MTQIEELRRRRQLVSSNANRHLDNMQKIADESMRVADVAANANAILTDLDYQFEKCTGLTKLDIAFLFGATALQIVRQYIFTKFPERLDDQAAAQTVYGDKGKNIGRKHRLYNPDLAEILNNPVPFDANIGAKGALSGGGYMGHRVTAIGHDPILGLIFGTANIATSTLTNNLLQSYHIYTNDINRDYFRNKADTGRVLYETKNKLIYQGLPGKAIVGASLAMEVKHLRSDINSKNSLPLPLVSVINPKMATDLAERGFDMANVVAVGKQAGYAVLINTLISMIHGLFYDESTEVNRRLYDVRTRKILSYSNIIASTSNLIYVGGNAAMGNEEAVRALDIGGLMVTVYRVATDTKFIRNAKKEFIEQEFFAQIRGSEYDFSE